MTGALTAGPFLVAFALALGGSNTVVGVMAAIPQPRRHSVHVPLAERFLRSLRDRNFRNLVYFLGSWNFAVNVAFLQVWGRFADRFSNKSVLRVSGPLFLTAVAAWTFTTMPDRYVLTFPLLIAIHIVMGIAMAGVAIASGNIGLKLAPKGQATAYLATATLANSLAAAAAPIVGGLLADFYAARELVGEVRRGMGNLSTIGGLRQLVQLSAFLSGPPAPEPTSSTPPPGTSESTIDLT